MSLEQAIHQYGGVGLLMWAVTLIIPIFVAWWRAGIKAQTVVSAEREVITNMLTKRDEDAREQAAKTEKLEGEIYLLKSTMSIEREEASAQIEELGKRVDEAKTERDQLEALLIASEARYQVQLEAAHSEIDILREQIDRLETEIRAMEGERQKLVDELYREMRTTARLTSELSFLRGQHDMIDRVLPRIQPAAQMPEITYNPSPV